MDALATLIKLNRRRLDEGRKQLAELERTRDGMMERLAELEAELDVEREVAGQGGDAAATFAAWLEAMRGRRDTLARSIADLDQVIDAQRMQVAEAFQDLKRVELVDERNRLRAAQAADRRMQAELDEMALSLYRREHEEGG